MADNESAAEALAAEAETDDTKRKTVTFGTGDDAITLDIPRRWKRFKFMRRINGGDMIGALECVFGADMVELLDELDLTEDEFTESLEEIASALGGVTVGNS